MRKSQLMFTEKTLSGLYTSFKAFYLKHDCWLTNVLNNVKTKWNQKLQYLKKLSNRPAIFR